MPRLWICTLANWWTPRLGPRRLVAEQASARGGRLGVELDGDRVRLDGIAVTTAEGQLTC
jgi:hypothetical protein